MRAKLLFLPVLSVVLLLLWGCGSSLPSSLSSYNFYQGTPELSGKFLVNAPPEKIYPLSSFRFILELDNQAAYPAVNGKVNLLGLDEKYFRLEQTEQFFGTLQGRDLSNPLGEQKRIEFAGTSGQLFSSAEEYVGNYFLKIDYLSKLEFADTLCLNPRFYDTFDAGCKENNKKTYSGQGAPVAVAEMEKITYPEEGNGAELEFRMALRNRGRGKVLNLTFISAQLGGEKLECSFRGQQEEKNVAFTSQQQEAVLICKARIKGSYSYATTLAASFAYSYSLEEKHRLRLVK